MPGNEYSISPELKRLDTLISAERKKLHKQIAWLERIMINLDPDFLKKSKEEEKEEKIKLAKEEAYLLNKLHSANNDQLRELNEELDKQLQEQKQLFFKQSKKIKSLCSKTTSAYGRVDTTLLMGSLGVIKQRREEDILVTGSIADGPILTVKVKV